MKKKKRLIYTFLLNQHVYFVFQTIFVVLLGPFAFFNVQKTKYLQMLTSVMRWLAFSIMILYAVNKLIIDGPQGNPSRANTAGKINISRFFVFFFSIMNKSSKYWGDLFFKLFY